MEATTIFNFLAFTPEHENVNAQTGDFTFIVFALIALISAIAIAGIVYAIRKKGASRTMISLAALLVLPLVVSGGLLLGQAKAIAAGEKPVNDQIDVYVNTEGGPVTYGEGATSNVQTYTNTSDERVILHKLSMDGTMDIGHWTAVRNDTKEVLFDGTVGTEYEFDNAISLQAGESVEVTWTTDTLSEDLFQLIGVTAPANATYKAQAGGVCLVHFEPNHDGVVVKDQIVEFEDYATLPGVSTYGEDFLVAWSENDGTFIPEFDFDNTPITEDITLYAKWETKAEAKAEAEEAAKESDKLVQDLVDELGLSTEAAEEFKANVQDILDAGKKEMDAAKTGPELNEAIKNLKRNLFSNFQGAATKTAEEDMVDSQKTIDNQTELPDISSSDREYFKNNMTGYFNTAKKNISDVGIDDEGNIDTIKEYIQSDKNSNAAEIVLAIELGATKKSTKATLEAAAEKDNEEISALPFFGQDNIAQYTGQIDQTINDTFNTMDDVHTVEGVVALKEAANAQMSATMAVAKAFSDKKVAKDAEIQAQKMAKEAEIDAKKFNATVTTNFKAEVQNAYDNFKTNLTDAKDEAGVAAATDTFDGAINKIDQEIKAFEEAIQNAKKAVNDAVAAGKTTIDALRNVTDKEYFNGEITKAQTAGMDAIDAATTTDDVAKAGAEAKAAIQKIAADAQALDQNIATSLASLSEEVSVLKAAISGMDYIGTDDANDFSNSLESAYTTAETSIKKSHNTDDVNSRVAEAETALTAIQTEANSLNNGKKAQATELETNIATAKTNISGLINKYFTSDNANKFIKQIDDYTTGYQKRIKDAHGLDAAKNVATQISSGVTSIYNNAKDLCDTKNTTYSDCEATSNAKAAEIDSTEGLSASDKTRFKDSVQSALTKVDTDLPGTRSVDEVNAVKKVFDDTVALIMEEAQALAGAKIQADASLTAIVNKFKDEIDEKGNVLQTWQISNYKVRISAAKLTADSEIAAATTPGAVENIVDTFKATWENIPNNLVKVSFTTAATDDIVFGDNDDVAEHKGIDFLGAEKGKNLKFKVYSSKTNEISITDGTTTKEISGSTTGVVCEFNIVDTVTISANYLFTVTAAVDTSGHGAVDPTTPIENVVGGTTYTIVDNVITINTATPQTITYTGTTDWEFEKWQANEEDVTVGGTISADTIFKAITQKTPTWLPLQANAAAETEPINFYPAFNSASDIAGYRFAVLNGSTYKEIKNVSTMADLYSALQPTEGEKTTTLYYAATSSAAPLKCYTTVDLKWNDVFVIDDETPVGTTYPAKATGYKDNFKNIYQKDSTGVPNGIETAQLNADFGSGFDVHVLEYESIPVINDTNYLAFVGAYTDLLSDMRLCPFGSYAQSFLNAFYRDPDLESWQYSGRDDDTRKLSIVLAKAFNTKVSVSGSVSLADGTSLSGMSVQAFDLSDQPLSDIAIAGEGGSYSLSVRQTTTPGYIKCWQGQGSWVDSYSTEKVGVESFNEPKTDQLILCKPLESLSINIEGTTYSYYPVISGAKKFETISFYDQNHELIEQPTDGYTMASLENVGYFNKRSGSAESFKTIRIRDFIAGERWDSWNDVFDCTNPTAEHKPYNTKAGILDSTESIVVDSEIFNGKIKDADNNDVSVNLIYSSYGIVLPDLLASNWAYLDENGSKVYVCFLWNSETSTWDNFFRQFSNTNNTQLLISRNF